MSLELAVALNALPVIAFLVLLFTDLSERLDRIWYGLSYVALNASMGSWVVIFSYLGPESMRTTMPLWKHVLMVVVVFGAVTALRVREDRKAKRTLDAKLAEINRTKEPR